MVDFSNIEGSPQWQTATFLVASAFILINAIRGWAIGLLRQALGLAAFCAACYGVVAWSASVGEILRPHLPSTILMPVSILLIWIVTFNLITLAGHILFQRTREYDSAPAQFVIGSGGAVIGALYGLLIVYCLLISLKVIGRIADDQVRIQQAKSQSSATVVMNLAKLRNSIELGWPGAVLDATDPLPSRFYREIDRFSRLMLDPAKIEKLLEYPGFRRVAADPRLLELQRDPEIAAQMQRGEIFGLLTNQKVVTLFNDPELRRLLSWDELDSALAYASTASDSADQAR